MGERKQGVHSANSGQRKEEVGETRAEGARPRLRAGASLLWAFGASVSSSSFWSWPAHFCLPSVFPSWGDPPLQPQISDLITTVVPAVYSNPETLGLRLLGPVA